MRVAGAIGGLLLAAGCPNFDDALVTCMKNGGCRAGLSSWPDSGPNSRPDSGQTSRVLRISTDAGRETDFPVLVTLGPELLTRVTDPRREVAFLWDGGESLAFDVDTWDAGGIGAFWVKVPTLDDGSVIGLVAGPNANGNYDPHAVWPDYDLVHHLGPDPGNSANAGYGATFIGGQPVDGVVGRARGFTGTGDQRVLFDGGEALFDGWPAFALSFWMLAQYAPTAADLVGEPGVMDKGGGLTQGRIFKMPMGMPRFQLDLHFTGGVGNDASLGAPLRLNGWMFIAFTFDGTVATLYVDGTVRDSKSLGGGTQALRPGQMPFFLGSAMGPLNGAIDELRIERHSRSANWISAQFASAQGQLVTVLQ
jgi:hypothetical protein